LNYDDKLIHYFSNNRLWSSINRAQLTDSRVSRKL